MRRWFLLCLCAAGLALATTAPAGPPVPFFEIIDTVRDLAAAEIGVAKKDINIIDSLAAQGFDENSLRSLIVAAQQEYNVVIPDREIYEAKQREPAVPLSVRVIASLVVQYQRPDL